MLEQLAGLVAGHLILQRKRADYWIAGVVIADTIYRRQHDRQSHTLPGLLLV
jgi:hypothetical protein